jgi:hypothetical protein
LIRAVLLCAALAVLGGCHIATQEEIQERYLEQMANQDDAYCKQQAMQSYDDCRKTRVGYRQTMMLGASADAQQATANAQQQQAQARAMCQLSGKC